MRSVISSQVTAKSHDHPRSPDLRSSQLSSPSGVTREPRFLHLPPWVQLTNPSTAHFCSDLTLLVPLYFFPSLPTLVISSHNLKNHNFSLYQPRDFERFGLHFQTLIAPRLPSPKVISKTASKSYSQAEGSRNPTASLPQAHFHHVVL
jgi:hypothetical protein